MENHVFLPDKRLIDDIYLYETTYDAVDKVPVWPTRKLTFNLSGGPITLGGRAYHSSCLFCISHDPEMVMVEKGEGDVVMINFRAGGLYRLFGLSGIEFGNQIVEAGHNRFPKIVDIGRALADAPDLEAKKRVLDEMFLELLEDALPDGLLGKFRFIAYWTKGRISVSDAADRLGVSARTLERDCKLRSGYSPKAILRRFRLAYLDWSNQNSAGKAGPIKFDLFGDDLPYSDQAHFLRDYRDLVGLSPTAMYEANHWRRRMSVCYHSRDDISVCESVGMTYALLENQALNAEYEANMRYFPYGKQTVKELGLEDWDTAKEQRERFIVP